MKDKLHSTFAQVRARSEAHCEPLSLEDYGLQAMPETSPPKWHLAHTSWFFETFILKPFSSGYRSANPHFEVLFNSYYNGIGDRHPRAERGLLSRPGLGEVLDYRHYVDDSISALLQESDHVHQQRIRELVELGIHHEQQHQELFFTDIKYSLSRNPLQPAYQLNKPDFSGVNASLYWREFDGGEIEIGYRDDGFCFDNEQPAHRALVQPFALASRPVSNGEYLAFIEDGGYQRPDLWLSDGWNMVQQQAWVKPLYWRSKDKAWSEFTLYGGLPLDLMQPACHLSAYEADAYARWAGARLPSEFEWELAAGDQPVCGQFVEQEIFHPQATESEMQLYGGVWEWTASAYAPYPGYQPAAGAIGEYNGKFMANQLVLRGGSCVTSADHIRKTYRNFFYPPDRWQFSGVRLAKWL